MAAMWTDPHDRDTEDEAIRRQIVALMMAFFAVVFGAATFILWLVTR